MANKGWIKLHRQMLNWEWKREPNTIALFVHLLLMANSDETYRYMGKELGVGQLVTSLDDLRSQTGLTLQEVRTALKHLIKTGEVTSKPTNKYRIITICNYASYQLIELQEQQAEQQATNNQLTSKSTGKITSQLTSKQQAQTADILNSYSCDDNGANKPANIPANIPANNIQEYIYYILSTEDEERKIEILESIINNISQKSQNADFASQEEQPKTAPKTAEPSSQLEQEFEEFRKAYRGRKRGHKEEFENFKKKNPDWREIIPLLLPALQRLEEYNKAEQAAGRWVSQWPHLQTWLNQRRWTEELPEISTPASQQPEIPMPPQDDEYAWVDLGSIDK